MTTSQSATVSVSATQAAASPDSSPRGVSQAHRRSFIASITGQLLEWYEWSAYAVFAPFIAVALFSTDNQVSALLATFGVFAIGFLFRPLGGIVFGRIADRRGRRFVLVTTMLLMAAGSVFIGLLPSFDSIGLFASVLLLLARIVQGFAHGGESAAANSYIAEIAPDSKRGIWGSAVFMTIFAGALLAFIVGGVITGVLSESAVQDWGWRIPFLLGALLALVALWLRTGMIESEVFADDESAATPAAGSTVAGSAATGSSATTVSSAAAASSTTAGLKQPVLSGSLATVLVFFLVSGVAASNYTWTSYVSTYAVTSQGMSANGAYWALVAALVIGLCALPAWGAISDRIGRKPVLYIFAVGVILTQFPLMGFIDERPWTLFLATSAALIVLSAGAALLAAVMAETFPTAARTSRIGLAYSLATAVFGGTTPYVNQLAVSLNIPWAANAFIVFAAALALWAVVKLPERQGADLRVVG